METRRFSVLHNAILGLDNNHSGSLPDVFPKLGLVDIDAKDSQSCTALFWAASLDDRQSVQCLLSYRADPNSRTSQFSTPLHRTRDPICLRMLLENGADINARDDLQQTPLLATVHSGVECAEVLLENGAIIDLPQYTGFTPLHFFVQNSEADLVQLFISRGADYTLRANDVSSIVHSAFRWADAKTLLVLAGNKLHGLHLHQKDDSGATGTTLAEIRRIQDPELSIAVDAFESSLRKAHTEASETVSATGKGPLRNPGIFPKMSPSGVEAQEFWSEDLGKTDRDPACRKLGLVLVVFGYIALWAWFTMGKGVMCS
ncbi:MAG: hypothetical protein Q9157_003391 [Trypethelium eluteriae]